MERLIRFLDDLSWDHPTLTKIIILVMLLLIIGAGISILFAVSGLFGFIGAILLDLCAFPTAKQLFELLTE